MQDKSGDFLVCENFKKNKEEKNDVSAVLQQIMLSHGYLYFIHINFLLLTCICKDCYTVFIVFVSYLQNSVYSSLSLDSLSLSSKCRHASRKSKFWHFCSPLSVCTEKEMCIYLNDVKIVSACKCT